jgi:hypothetical protein
MARALILCLLPLLLLTGSALAQATQLFVRFDASIEPAAQAAMRSAIAAELSASLLEQPADGVPELHVARAADGQLALTLRDNPAPVTRSVPFSDDAATLARDAALMAKNLVQDQAAELLLPEPASAQPPPLAAPPAPAPAQAQDAELPPGFAPTPAAAPAAREPEEGARLVLLAMVAPALVMDARVAGRSHPARTLAGGLHARAEAPIGLHFAAGGGIQLAMWNDELLPSRSSTGLTESPGTLNVNANSVMDASAWLRAHTLLAGGVQLYALLGAGPSAYSVVNIGAPGLSHRASPYLGMNASLLAGASLRFTRSLGAVLEIGPVYHLVHGRDQEGERAVVHALQLGVQLGARWVFDAY